MFSLFVAGVRHCVQYNVRPGLVAIYLLYNLFCAPPRTCSGSCKNPTRLTAMPGLFVCGAGHGGYYIRLLSQKIILPGGLLGFSLCICQPGSHAVTQRERIV